MKKILPALVVLLALGAAGATVYLAQKPAQAAGAASATVGYLPPETLALLSLPDPQQTAADWKTTDLYKIWTEPSVQEFFAKPLSKIPTDKSFDDTLAQIGRVAPHNLFIALTTLDEKNNEPHLVAGFQFKGSNADVEQLLSKPKAALSEKQAAGKKDLVKYQDHSLETFTDENGKTIASVYVNDWYFISNDVALLKATLDRVDHRAPAGSGSLDGEADFKAVLAKMPANPATLVFVRPRIFFDRIFALAASSGQTMSDEQLAEVRKIKAVGATTTIDNGKLRDTLYSLAPGYKMLGGPLQMSALTLTSPDTLAFYAAVLQLPDHYDLPPNAATGPNAAGYALFGQYADQWKANGLTLQSFNAAFGREVSAQLDWPAGSGQPSLALSLDVHDPAAAAKFLEGFVKTLPPDTKWQLSNAGGLTYRSLVLPNVSTVTPTLTLTDKHLIVGLSAAEVRAAAGHEKAGGANFTASEAYKTASGTVGKPNLATSYIDAKPLFDRTYALAKPMAIFGAAFAGPQVNDYVDLSKLPEGDAISKHLSPIILSEKADEQGVLLESVGSVTFIQASAGLGAVIGAAAVPILQKQFAGALGHKDADDAPDSTPAASPQPSVGQ